MTLSKQCQGSAKLISAETVNIDIDTEQFPFREPKNAVSQYEIILGTHATAEDFPLSLRESFETSDIILHEQIGWIQKSVDALDRTSAGIDEPIFQDPDGINERKKQLLFGTNVKNGYWDVPAGHMSVNELLGYHRILRTTPNAWDTYFTFVTKRDKLALRTLGRTLDRIMVNSDIEKPKVVIVAGLSHLVLANSIRLNTDTPVTVRTTYEELPPNIEVSETMKRLKLRSE